MTESSGGWLHGFIFDRDSPERSGDALRFLRVKEGECVFVPNTAEERDAGRMRLWSCAAGERVNTL